MPDDVAVTEAGATTTDAGSATTTPETAPTPWSDPVAAEKRINELVKEAGDYRTAYKPFKDAFDGVNEQARGEILRFVETLKADPANAGSIARAWADELTPAERGEMAEAAGATDDDAPMTKAEFAKAMEALKTESATQQAAQRQADFEADLERQARDIGIDPAADPKRYNLLLQFLVDNPDQDVKAAKSAMEEWLAGGPGGRDEFVEKRRADAAGTARAPVNGAASGTAKTPQTVREAGLMAREALANMDL